MLNFCPQKKTPDVFCSLRSCAPTLTRTMASFGFGVVEVHWVLLVRPRIGIWDFRKTLKKKKTRCRKENYLCTSCFQCLPPFSSMVSKFPNLSKISTALQVMQRMAEDWSTSFFCQQLSTGEIQESVTLIQSCSPVFLLFFFYPTAQLSQKKWNRDPFGDMRRSEETSWKRAHWESMSGRWSAKLQATTKGTSGRVHPTETKIETQKPLDFLTA